MTDLNRMTPPHRAKLVLLVLAVAIVGLGVWAWEPVWWWVMTERTYIELPSGTSHSDLSERGWAQLSRWSNNPHGPFDFWYKKDRLEGSRGLYSCSRGEQSDLMEC